MRNENFYISILFKKKQQINKFNQQQKYKNQSIKIIYHIFCQNRISQFLSNKSKLKLFLVIKFLNILNIHFFNV